MRLTLLAALALVGVLVAGCIRVPEHSNYFVVSFLAKSTAPLPEGVTALDLATKQALSSKPTFIQITVAAVADGTEPVLQKQRGQIVLDTFTKAGIDPSLSTVTIETVTAEGFAARQDTVIVQLGYGKSTDRFLF